MFLIKICLFHILNSLLILSKKTVNLLKRVVSILKNTFVLHSVFLPTALHNAMVHTVQIPQAKPLAGASFPTLLSSPHYY